MLKLSILDQSIAVAGRPHGQSIRDTLQLARLAEDLGYARFWVSEHHNHPTIVGTAPEILIAAIAVSTQRIRVGAAGIMLPHYSPFKVAEQFRVLDALAPGRIDLGLGRAPGSDGLTAYALHPMADERPNHFPADVRDLMAWISGQPLIEKHPFATLKALPQGDTVPEVWLLGSSTYGAQVAAHFGLPYAFAWFFSDGRGGPEAIAAYRQNYRPSAQWPKPHAAFCVFALAAPTRAEAEFHYMSRGKWQLYRDGGTFLPFEAPEVADAHPFTDSERARIDRLRARAFVGEPAEVADRIRAMAREFDLAEMALVTWTHDEAVRRRSFTLLAEAFAPELKAAATG